MTPDEEIERRRPQRSRVGRAPARRRRPWIFLPPIVAGIPCPPPPVPTPEPPRPAGGGGSAPDDDPAVNAAEPDEESEIRAGASATISWGDEVTRDPVTISRYLRSPLPDLPRGQGVYIVMREGGPVYVGKATNTRGGLARRWYERYLSMYQMGLISVGAIPTALCSQVYFGVVTPASSAVISTVERALMRALVLSGLVPLSVIRNGADEVGRPFTARDTIEIQAFLPKKLAAKSGGLKYYDQTQNKLTIPGGQSFEVFPELMGDDDARLAPTRLAGVR
jgi:hypothetical protein